MKVERPIFTLSMGLSFALQLNVCLLPRNVAPTLNGRDEAQSCRAGTLQRGSAWKRRREPNTAVNYLQ